MQRILTKQLKTANLHLDLQLCRLIGLQRGELLSVLTTTVLLGSQSIIYSLLSMRLGLGPPFLLGLSSTVCLVVDPIWTSDHICVLFKSLRVLKWYPLCNEMRGPLLLAPLYLGIT
jgi:hypothetical protein